jgi:hypothetical protein
MKAILRIITILIISGGGIASGFEADATGSDRKPDPIDIPEEPDIRNRDSDGDGIPDYMDRQPHVSAHGSADADNDGIPDEADAEPAEPRGPPPSIVSENASNHSVCNVIAGEVVRMVLGVNNPGGPMPATTDLTLFVNGTGETVEIAALGDTPPFTRSFLLSWTAKTAKGYPLQTLQNLSLRFRDAQQATAWLNLARIDVAEWEGMIAGLRIGKKTPGGWNLGVRSHRNGAYGGFTTLSTALAGSSIWYRGPRSIPVTQADSLTSEATAQIPANARYPLVFLSSVTGESFQVNSVIDVSDPVRYPHDQFWINNQYPGQVRVSLVPGGDHIVPSGETVCQPMVEPPGNDAAAASLTYFRNSANGEKLIAASSIGLVTSQRDSRRINLVNFIQNPPDSGRISYNGHSTFLPVSVQITPHAAGSPEHPGLPLPDGYHIGSNRSARLPLGQGRHHMLVLKVGPDAAALSNGIGIRLRKGGAGDADHANPLPGFTVMVLDPDGTHRNAPIPADGKLSYAAGSPNWRQLTSPQGLTLFLKRDASVTATHHLGIELLKKRGWHPLESVRIAAIDIIPVNEVADNARDWPDLVENRIGDREGGRSWSGGD